MGVVHLGVAPDGTQVAIKVLRQQIVGDEEARERLAREVSSLQLVHSRWVAEILDADPWGPTPYVVTRYVPGRSLYQTVAEDGPIRGDDLVWLARGLLEGIGSVHDAGVLHRDVKPSNVLMEGRTPVLIDFGLARVADDPRLTQTGWLLGTPGYLAPEVLYGDDPTEAVDVHAWAGTIVYAATGRPPFGKGPAMAIMDRTRRGEHDLRGIEEPMRSVLEWALAPEPEDRPTLAQLQERLRHHSTDPTVVHRRMGRDLVPAPAPTAVLPEWEPSVEDADEHEGFTALEPYPLVEPAPAPAPLAPRLGIGERSRRAVLWVLVMASCAMALAAYPWVGSVVVLVVVWVVRSSSLAATRVEQRRAERGARWHDRPRLVLGAPVDLVRALPSTVVLGLWACGMVVATVLLCYAVASPVTLALLCAGAVCVLALLLGSGGAQVRSPLSRVIVPLASQPRRWLISVLILVAVTGVGAGFAARGADWTPFSQAPFSGLEP